MALALRDLKSASSRGEQPTADEVQATVQRLTDLHRRRTDVDFEMTQLLWCDHAVPLPADVAKTKPTEVHAMLGWKQAGLVLGVMSNQRPTLKVATQRRGQTKQDEAESMAGYANKSPHMIERQSGEKTFELKTIDQLVYGRGVVALEPLTGQYKGAPTRDTYKGNDDAYLKDLSQWKAKQGTQTGRLPVLRRHVSATNFYAIENPEEGGLTVTAEKRIRYLRDLKADPRYRDHLGGIGDWYDKLASGNQRVADLVQCGLWIVQDKDWCSYALLPLSFTDNDQADDQIASYAWGLQQSLGAQLIYQHPNRLGRPNYVVTPGLPSPTADPARKQRGIFYDARHLMREVCETLTIRSIRLRNNAFPAWIFIEGPQRQNETDVLPAPQSPEQRQVKLARGNGMVTKFYNGTLQQVLETGTPDEQPHLDDIGRRADSLMLSDEILSGGASGYEYNSLRNTIMARLNPILRGQEVAAVREFEMEWDWLAVMGESASVSAIESNGAATYTLDPRETDFEDLVIEAEFELERPEDDQAKAQLVKTYVEAGIYDMQTAREKVLKETNHKEIDFRRALEAFKQDPAYQQAIKQRAARDAGILLDQQAAQDQAPPGLEQLLEVSKPLLQALGNLVAQNPAAPGAQRVMQAMQKAGMAGQQPQSNSPAPPPAAGGQVAAPPAAMLPAPPPALGVGGGRAAGQAVQAGGPNMTGGFA
jgi:hypothetical protein